MLLFKQEQHGFSDTEVCHALATAGVIGNIIKTNASISGAECGCQAEVGSACSMAAAGLAELYHMELDQIEYAAEVAMEHHLGLTCDPIGGLVQIPCIERNAVAAMRAINALSLANFLTYTRKISFDVVVRTMYETAGTCSPSTGRPAKGAWPRSTRNKVDAGPLFRYNKTSPLPGAISRCCAVGSARGLGPPRPQVRVLSPRPRRGESLWLTAIFIFENRGYAFRTTAPPRKRSRSARLLACKRAHNALACYQLFADKGKDAAFSFTQRHALLPCASFAPAKLGRASRATRDLTRAIHHRGGGRDFLPLSFPSSAKNRRTLSSARRFLLLLFSLHCRADQSKRTRSEQFCPTNLFPLQHLLVGQALAAVLYVDDPPEGETRLGHHPLHGLVVPVGVAPDGGHAPLPGLALQLGE